MKNSILYLAAIWTVFTLGSCGSRTDSPEQAKDTNEMKDSSNAITAMDKHDADFMVEAADGGMMEVELGAIAQQQGSNPLVKSYGAMMVRDHNKGNDELKKLAAQKDVSLPVAMGDDKMKKVNDMRSEKDFDKKYMDMMVSDHKEDIDKFEDVAKNGKDSELKTWASTMLITLRMHLDSAEYINDRLKGKK